MQAPPVMCEWKRDYTKLRTARSARLSCVKIDYAHSLGAATRGSRSREYLPAQCWRRL